MGKKGYPVSKEDVTDYYNLQVERHKDYYSEEDHFGCESNNKNEIENSSNKVSFLALGLLLVFGWYG